MSSLYSDEDKERVVKNFLYARSIKKAWIEDFKPIMDYMENKMTLLVKIEKTGINVIDYTRVKAYSEYDANLYFEWLISAVSGTLPIPVDEECYKRAINHIFFFIFTLDGVLHSDVDLFEPCKIDDILEVRLRKQDERLSSLEINMNIAKEIIKRSNREIDRVNEKIVKTLERILDWEQFYKPYLDQLVEQNKEANNIEKSLSGGNKDGEKK